MAIKKDAAKADIGPKRQVKATFAECTAVEPLKCKYHGLKALDKMIGNILASSGHPMPFVTDKHDNEYELRLPGDIDLPMSTFSKISEALKNQGFSIFNKGQTEEGAFKYKIKPVDGKEFVTPDGEAELEDADTLSADKPKEKKEGEPKSEEKKDDVDNLESPHKQAEAQAQVEKEDTSMDVDFLDDLLAEMYDLGIQKDKNFLGSWSTLNQEVDEADEHDGKKIKSLIEKAQKLKKEYIDAHKGKSVKQDLFEELENIDADALVDEAELDADLMENFDELDEVVGDAEKDLEAELIGNSDFDDIVFFDDEGNEKGEGKEKAETPPTLSLQDIKDLVSFKGVKEEHFEQNDDLAGTYNAIITTGKNPNGSPLTENQVTWWNDLLDKTKEANPDELPALKVLKETMKKVNGGGGDDGQPFTDDDLKDWLEKAGWGAAAKNPEAFEHTKENLFEKKVYGAALSDSAMKSYVFMANKIGAEHPVSAYILKEFTKDADKGLSSDHAKYQPMWNALIETAVKEKKLMGTQYWAETIAPIIDEWNSAIAKGEENLAPEENDLSDIYFELKKAVNHAPDGGGTEKTTKQSLIDEMQSVIDKIHDTGLDLTWDNDKGMALGDKFGDAINANDLDAAAKALADFKDYVHKLETGDEETKVSAEDLTTDEIKDFFQKCGIKKSALLTEANLEATKTALATGEWFGKPLTSGNKKWYKALADKVPDHKVAQAINAMLESGVGDTSAAKPKKFTLKAIKEFLLSSHGPKMASIPTKAKDVKDILEKGQWHGAPLAHVPDMTLESLAQMYDTCKDGPIKDALLTALGKKPSAKKEFSDKEIKDFLGTYKGENPIPNGDLAVKQIKEIIEKGSLDGTPIKDIGGDWSQYFNTIDACADGPIKDAFYAAFGKKAPNASSSSSSSSATSTNGASTKEALLSALSGGGKSMAVEGMLKPLEHDEAKFPQNVTQKELENAIAHPIKVLSGHGKLSTRLIEIDGKQYVCKSASGTNGSIVRNGFNADMAYRAGGIYAPDAKLYTFGDGKVYKLAEFIKGKTLWDVWSSADEPTRDKIRKDILKGYPLDVLFSNYDVLGTSPEVIDDHPTLTIPGADGKPQKTHVAFDNIIIGDDGHAYRIDNDGAFAMKGNGNPKGANWEWADETDEDGKVVKGPDGKPKKIKVSAIFGKNAKVAHEFYDNWEDREWIDDFRTMRRNERCAGIFDRYSTADIFLSAANIDIGSVVATLPKGIQDAVAKPASEMKEMAEYAKGTRLAGYPPSSVYTWKDSSGNQQAVKIDPVSTALDAIYEANKQGVRPFLQKKVSWVNTGWLSGSGGGAAYVPKVFPKPEPKEPKPPAAGTDLAKEVLEGIKTINYHAAQGNGNVNQSRIDKALAVKPMVEMLADAGNDRAKGILEAIGKIEESIKNGHGKEIKFNTDNGFFDVSGLSIVMGDKEKAVFDKANEDKHKKWEKEHKAWQDEKDEHDRKEKEKAKKAGAAPSKSFQVFEDDLITAMVDTDGIKHGGGDPSINHSSKSSQKDSSFNFESSKKKVRQYAMMGIPLDQMYFENSDPTFYNGHIENGGSHVSGGDGKPNFYAAVQFYQDNPEQFRKDMESYARHKGMMALVHMNMDNEAIDRETGTVFVIRGEHSEAWGKNGKGSPNFSVPTIIKPWAIDSSTSACINETGHFGGKAVAWKLPIWRVTDNFMIGHGSEQEICINPINIPYPAMYFPNPGSGADGCKKCQDIYSKAKEVIAVDKKLGKEV